MDNTTNRYTSYNMERQMPLQIRQRQFPLERLTAGGTDHIPTGMQAPFHKRQAATSAKKRRRLKAQRAALVDRQLVYFTDSGIVLHPELLKNWLQEFGFRPP